MATTRTYVPIIDGSSEQWTISTGSNSWAVLDETIPSFTDNINTSTVNNITLVKTDTGTYVSEPMIPWTSWAIEIFAKKAAGTPNPTITAVIRYDGVNYEATAQAVTSTLGGTLFFTWTTPPWSVTGKTNWGVAASAVEFGVKYVSGALTVTVGNIKFKCVHPDHTPGTPTDPDDPRVKTGQDELDGASGSQNPTVNYPVPWDAAFNARMQYADMGGCYIEVGTSEGGHEMWQSVLLQFGDEYGDEVRCPDQRHAGSILQDGIQYYWRLKAVTVWGEETAWVAGGTFYGVTDSGTWSSDYHARANIRFGTSHSALPVDYTVNVPFQTGYGRVVSTYGWVNEAIQHSARAIAHYDGFTYNAFLGQDAVYGTIMIYVQRINTATGEASAVYELHDTGTGGDTHYYPALLVGADHKLHLWVGSHGSQGYYFRTSNAHVAGSGIDITAWSGPTSITGLSDCTYIRPVMDSAGVIYLFFRHKITHYGYFCYIYSTNNGSSWSSLKYIVYYSDYIESPPSVYCGGVAIDANDRVHIVLSWWDNYGSGNRGRGISCIYADKGSNKYETWYQFGNYGSLGYTQDSANSTCIQYADANKVAVCGDPTTNPLTGPFVHTNSEALVVDGNNYPHFVYYSYSSNTGEETPVYYVYWSGSAWVTVDLYTDESLPKLWKYRQGGQLYYDDGRIYIYGFVKPTGETYFGGELYCYRRIIDTNTWAGYYLSSNTGKGIGMISVLPKRYAGQERELVFSRCNDVVWMQDKPNTLVRYDGADVRIVEAYNNGSSIVRTELDRLPDAFGLVTSYLQFGLNTAVAANANAPTDRIIQVYFGNSSASSPPNDYTEVFLYLENFEDYDTNTDLDDQGGWVCTANDEIMVSHSYDNSNCAWAHTNKLWDGDKFIWVYQNDSGGVAATKSLSDTYPGLGADVTDVAIYFHFWDESGTGIFFVTLYDATLARWIRIGFNCSSNQAGYQTDDGSWTNVVNCSGNRYYEFLVTITSGGVSAWINGTSIVSANTRITVFDSIGFGATDSGIYMFDSIRIVKYVATAPTVTTTQANAEVFFTAGSNRLGGRIMPVMAGTTRMAGKVIGDKMGGSHSAAIIIGEKSASSRERETVIPEAGDSLRLGNGIFVDKTEIAAVMSAVIPDKTSRQRVAELVAAEVSGFDHVNHELIAEATDYERLAADIIVELVRSGRLAATMIAEAIGTSRLPELMQLEAWVTDRMMNLLQAEPVGQSRFDNLSIAEKTTLARMMSVAILEAVVTGRFGGIAIPDKTERGAVGGMVQPDKTEDARFMAMVIAEAIAEGHLAAILQPELTGRSRIHGGIMPEAGHTERAAHLTRADKTALARIIGKMLAEVVGKGRIGNRSQADKLTAARIASTLNVDVTELTRIMHRIVLETSAQFSHVHHVVRPDKAERMRLAERAIAEARSETRLPQLTQAEKMALAKVVGLIIAEIAASGRFRNMAFGDKIALVRLSSELLADKVVRSRVCNIAPLEGILTERFAQFLQAEVRQSTSFAQTIRLQGMTASRIINLLIADKQARARLRNHLIMEDHQVTRLCHGLLAEWRTETKIGEIFRAEVAAFGRLAGQIIVEAADSARVHNLSMPEYDILARLCHLLLLEPSGCGRLSNRVLLEAIIRGLQILRIHLGTPRLINVRVTVPHLKGTYIRQPALTDISIGMPHLKNVRIVSPGIEPITSDANGEPVWVR